jgi:hypothetical protein
MLQAAGAKTMTTAPKSMAKGGKIKGPGDDEPPKEPYKESTLENVIEIIDPSGFSSWNDIRRSYQKSGMSDETKLEIFGAIPLLGKVGKAGKLVTASAKGVSRLARNTRIVGGVMQSIPYVGRSTDAAQAIEQYPDAPLFPTPDPYSVNRLYISPYADGGKIKKSNNVVSGLLQFKGPKHGEGGIPFQGVEVEGGETNWKNYIFSDRLKYAK